MSIPSQQAHQPVAFETLNQNLNWRYAVKKFDPARKIDDATWANLEQALVLSPSSYGLQPFHFVVVTDPAARQRLRAAGYNQSQITDASHVVVFCRRDPLTAAHVEEYVARIAEVRGVTAESMADFKKTMLGGVNNPAGLPGGSAETYGRSQVYIALGFFLYTAAQLNVDACPMEGFDPKQFDEILGLKSKGYASCVMATVGYRASDDWLAGLEKVRAERGEVITRI